MLECLLRLPAQGQGGDPTPEPTGVEVFSNKNKAYVFTPAGDVLERDIPQNLPVVVPYDEIIMWFNTEKGKWDYYVTP
jgi:hypothetical protein